MSEEKFNIYLCAALFIGLGSVIYVLMNGITEENQIYLLVSPIVAFLLFARSLFVIGDTK